MNDATTVAIDLAKDVFELAFGNGMGQIVERKRLSRRAFARCLENRPRLEVVMEACGIKVTKDPSEKTAEFNAA